MYLKKLIGVTTRQFIEHRFYVGGNHGVPIYLKRYVMGLKSERLIYCFKYQYLFLKQTLLILSNTIRTYYDKVLFINGHYGYSDVFKHLCLILDMPFLYTRWVYGTLSNIYCFLGSASRISRNNLDGFYTLSYVPSVVFNLTGLYNFPSLKEGRTLGAAVCGILDYDLSVLSNKHIFFDKYNSLNYLFLGNDDNVKSLNFVMYLTIITLYYRKLFLFTLMRVVNYDGNVPFYFNDLNPTKAVSYTNGSMVLFYKSFGSYRYLQRFYWFRSLKDYYFFRRVSYGNYERLAQQFVSHYSYSSKKAFFYKEKSLRNLLYPFFNLADFDFLQQIHVALINIYTKVRSKTRAFVGGKYIKMRYSVFDHFTIFSFFLNEKRHYLQLVRFYGSLVYPLDYNLKFSYNFFYYKYIHSKNNILNYKILMYYKKVLNTNFIFNESYNKLKFNLFSKLRRMYSTVYFFYGYNRIQDIYRYNKIGYRFYYNYFFYRRNRSSYSLMFSNYSRLFFSRFRFHLEKVEKVRFKLWKKQCFRNRFPRFGYGVVDYIYYYDFYKEMLLIMFNRLGIFFRNYLHKTNMKKMPFIKLFKKYNITILLKNFNYTKFFFFKTKLYI